jgi:N,N'-diacetyllegionaminate synthase
VNVNRVQIGNRSVGDGKPCYIIAEAGSNHNGSLALAEELVAVAAEAGADAVKFQTFTADAMYARESASVDYLSRLGITKPIYEIIADIEMPRDWIPRLADCCSRHGIAFLSTPFDNGAADLLAPYVPAFKIASYELTHIPLIRYVSTIGKPMILSTGAATIPEIEEAVKEVRAVSTAGVILTQCTARYPAEPESINLRVLPALAERFAVPVGLSDHSRHHLWAPLAAVAAGASVLEKHFTLSRRLPGPDHSFAIEPGELTEMIAGVREVERVLGTSDKQVQEVEQELVNFRRGIFSARPLRKGEEITLDAMIILRRSGQPATDVSPADLDRLVGRRAARDLPAQALLSMADFA